MDQARLATENILEYIKRRVNEKLPKQEFSIPHIKQVAEEVASISSTYWKQKCPLNAKEVERLQNLSVAIYLKYWLQHDRNATSTIADFAQYGFSLQNEEKESQTHKDNSVQERSLRNHRNRIMEMLNEVKRQAKKDNRPYTVVAMALKKIMRFLLKQWLILIYQHRGIWLLKI